MQKDHFNHVPAESRLLICEAAQLLFPESHQGISAHPIDGARVIFKPSANIVCVFGRGACFMPADEIVPFLRDEQIAAAQALPPVYDGSEFSAWVIARTIQHIIRDAAGRWSHYRSYVPYANRRAA